MADINLLGINSRNQSSWNVTSWVARGLMVILAILILYYIYLFWQTNNVNGQITDLQTKTAQAQQDALKQKDREQLVTRQGQLQALNSIIKQHVYWSGLLPELARVTLKSATYADINADSSGGLNMVVDAPDYPDLDKYLQVFDLPQYSQQFSDVKVMSINRTQQGSSLDVEMRLQLKFNPNFIHSATSPNAGQP